MSLEYTAVKAVYIFSRYSIGSKKPLISILHTILKEPSYVQRIIIREIAEQSSKIIVMSQRAVQFLTEIYEIPIEKIQIIEHGVPDVDYQEITR